MPRGTGGARRAGNQGSLQTYRAAVGCRGEPKDGDGSLRPADLSFGAYRWRGQPEILEVPKPGQPALRVLCTNLHVNGNAVDRVHQRLHSILTAKSPPAVCQWSDNFIGAEPGSTLWRKLRTANPDVELWLAIDLHDPGGDDFREIVRWNANHLELPPDYERWDVGTATTLRITFHGASPARPPHARCDQGIADPLIAYKLRVACSTSSIGNGDVAVRFAAFGDGYIEIFVVPARGITARVG